MKKALITGANGFVGSSLIQELLKNNIEVIAAVRKGHNICIDSRFVEEKKTG